MRINKETIQKRERELKKAAKYLKSEFIGIDDIIDKFINSVKVWYIIPEIQSRPLIINLWGITGVGKTDLVRKFVKAIKFNDRFTEIQMDSKDGSGTIEDYLESTFESNESQGVLLLDEIQRFRTIKDNGEENDSNKFQDLWMLLSDGVFQSNAKIKQQLMQMLLDEKYWAERGGDDDDDDIEEAEKNKKRTFKTSWWDASRLKRLLKLSDNVSDIMKWDDGKKMDLVKSRLNNGETYEGKKYSKLLIIISGNLDEAFTMASNVGDADRDADVYHEYSKSIDIITIKNALRERFKPEQIARMGNIHLIYPIPNRKAYESIIEQKVNNILTNILETNDINIIADQSVLDAIYKNGVFPTQGVRPVISTVSSMLENSLPKFLFEYLKSGETHTIELRFKNGYLLSEIGSKTIKYEVPTVLDDIKCDKSLNERALVSVHEAGHAVLYALLFKTSPTQIVASTLNQVSSGFIGIHTTSGGRMQQLDEVKITFGGRIAEEIVFGDDFVSHGASGDYSHATSIIGDYVRTNGLDTNIGVYRAPIKNDGSFKHDINSTDGRIEVILNKLYIESKTLLENNLEFLLEVTEALVDKSALTPIEFKEIADKYIPSGITLISASDDIEVNYDGLLKKYLKEKGN